MYWLMSLCLSGWSSNLAFPILKGETWISWSFDCTYSYDRINLDSGWQVESIFTPHCPSAVYCDSSSTMAGQRARPVRTTSNESEEVPGWNQSSEKPPGSQGPQIRTLLLTGHRQRCCRRSGTLSRVWANSLFCGIQTKCKSFACFCNWSLKHVLFGLVTADQDQR